MGYFVARCAHAEPRVVAAMFWRQPAAGGYDCEVAPFGRYGGELLRRQRIIVVIRRTSYTAHHVAPAQFGRFSAPDKQNQHDLSR